MLNKNLIKTKIRSIQEYLVEIEPILSLPKDQVVSNIEKFLSSWWKGKSFRWILPKKFRRLSGLEIFLCTVMKKLTEVFLLIHFKRTDRILINTCF